MSGPSLRSFEYLEGLPGTVHNKLYQQPSTALAIFRLMLPPLGTASLCHGCTLADGECVKQRLSSCPCSTSAGPFL